MFQKDFVLRQIQQLVQALAQVLNLKAAGQIEDARNAISDALDEHLKVDWAEFLKMSVEEKLDVCRREGELRADLMLVLAEMLEEECDLAAIAEDWDAFENSGKSSIELYQKLLEMGAPVPLDIMDRLQDLRSKVEKSDGIDPA